MKFTTGINSYDKHDGQWVLPVQLEAKDWSEYVDLLQAFHSEPGPFDPSDAAKKLTTWTAAFLLPPNSRRLKENLIGHSSFMPFDLDVPGWSVERLDDRLSGVARCYYTTTNSRATAQRWRIVLQLDREITVTWDSAGRAWYGEYVSVWHFVNELLDCELDRQTCNANRIMVVPRQWMRADNLFYRYDGLPLPVVEVLKEKPVIKPKPWVQPDVGLKAAPDGTPIITDKMKSDFHASKKGGRYIHLVSAAACRFVANGWELTAAELDAAATGSVGIHDKDHLREAERAIEWASCHVETKSPWRRFQDRIRYGLANSKSKA